MKYGENFEKESVPEWSLHNIDYNSLKYYIKVHTTKDQAKAIAIPGQADTTLAKVEDELYLELCRQHDRVDLFVNAKADEIQRRLQHLSDQIHQLLLSSTDDSRQLMPLKRQRKFIRLERDTKRCGDEIQDLQRFVNAQVQAFRKILKKYKKWTGSGNLSSRFKDNVLNHPKSFTRKDFSPLQQAYNDLIDIMQLPAPANNQAASPVDCETRPPPSRQRSVQSSLQHARTQNSAPQTPVPSSEQPRYWNEYDDGSEAGDMDDGYAIYINRHEEDSGNGLKAFFGAFTAPMEKARAWMKVRQSEHQSLLSRDRGGFSYGATDTTPGDSSYFTVQPGHGHSTTGNDSSTAVDTDGDDADDDIEPDIGYASPQEFSAGYEAHIVTLPSINDQRIHRYREKVLSYGTLGLFLTACVVLGIATILITTGRHKLHAEVDAGVTIGVVMSLGCACSALALTTARRDPLGVLGQIALSVTFTAICIVSGALLVLVMGNTGS